MFSNPIVEEASPSAIDVFDGEEIKNDAIIGEEQALSRSIRQDSLNIAGIDITDLKGMVNMVKDDPTYVAEFAIERFF